MWNWHIEILYCLFIIIGLRAGPYLIVHVNNIPKLGQQLLTRRQASSTWSTPIQPENEIWKKKKRPFLHRMWILKKVIFMFKQSWTWFVYHMRQKIIFNFIDSVLETLDILILKNSTCESGVSNNLVVLLNIVLAHCTPLPLGLKSLPIIFYSKG